MTFYTTRDTINPDTGYDSLSGKSLPPWISQISSFDMKTFMKHRGFFREVGLRIADYMVEVNVTTKSYSHLMQDIWGELNLGTPTPTDPPLFVMMDAEGFDCDILVGIDANSKYWPSFLVFEHAHCKRRPYFKVIEKLEKLGYTLYKQPKRGQNTLAIRNAVATS